MNAGGDVANVMPEDSLDLGLFKDSFDLRSPILCGKRFSKLS
jgi:hypothetical protein